MRFLAMALAMFWLGGCDSGDVPSPADRQAGLDTPEPVEANLIKLDGNSLVAGAEAFYFSAGQSEVEAALGRVLGAPLDRQTNQECGAGPMDMAAYSSGLTVNFQQGVFVGWWIDEAADNVAIDEGFDVGTSRETAQGVSGFSWVADSTLGEEFTISGELAGFIEEDEVSMLYAGIQCFFR